MTLCIPVFFCLPVLSSVADEFKIEPACKLWLSRSESALAPTSSVKRLLERACIFVLELRAVYRLEWKCSLRMSSFLALSFDLRISANTLVFKTSFFNCFESFVGETSWLYIMGSFIALWIFMYFCWFSFLCCFTISNFFASCETGPSGFCSKDRRNEFSAEVWSSVPNWLYSWLNGCDYCGVFFRGFSYYYFSFIFSNLALKSLF